MDLDVPEQDRPRTLRKLGIKPPLDEAFDSRDAVSKQGVGALFAKSCRLYRGIRPSRIGDRCAFEPSCSRYAEYCFENFRVFHALQLTFERIRLCKGSAGGIHLPPDNFKKVVEDGGV